MKLLRQLINIKMNVFEKNQYLFLSCKTKDILLGSLLGDGSLKLYNQNARFSFRHTINQKDYFL
jgi:hypothetical protein